MYNYLIIFCFTLFYTSVFYPRKFVRIFGIESKDCYRFYIDIKRRKNESRTYFLDRMQEKLNERMLRDEEMERLRK